MSSQHDLKVDLHSTPILIKSKVTTSWEISNVWDPLMDDVPDDILQDFVVIFAPYPEKWKMSDMKPTTTSEDLRTERFVIVNAFVNIHA